MCHLKAATASFPDFIPTSKQLEAIRAPLGPVLIIAGPGAGKTFCMIGRIQYLIEDFSLDPRRICAVTFTNKAAGEVTQRLRRKLGVSAEELTCGTLHSFCHKLLRSHPKAAGLRSGFGIADKDYQHVALGRLGVWPPERQGHLLTLFRRHRLHGYPLEQSDLQLFQTYRKGLRSRNLVDYDDLIDLAAKMLRCDRSIASQEGARWDCILVDEGQDLSIAQYNVIATLADSHRNCFMVGDDEQSIFCWAGADSQILRRFQTDFSVADVISLDSNHRCSRQIFSVARRLIACGPAQFAKNIVADRESRFAVRAFTFEDESSEAAWIIADLRHDCASSSLEWGEYGLLYRKHTIGEFLEAKLLEAGIPCRLAPGHALMDDAVVAYIISSIQVIQFPDDPLVVEAFAKRVLPATLLNQVRAIPGQTSLLTALRTFASTGHQGDGDTRKAWRFIYHLSNLAALGRTHDSLAPLVSELLSQRLGRYRNPLEDHAKELSDPADYSQTTALADRLAASMTEGRPVWVQEYRGVDIALGHMLTLAGIANVRRLGPEESPGSGDCVLRPSDADPGHWALLVFKTLQLLRCRGNHDRLRDYVSFDIETTDLNVGACEIVEIAAVRVRAGTIIDQFHRLVRPERPISAPATEVHGYRDADLCDEPSFADVWPEFRTFVGADVLVAHNGQEFDLPVVRRMAEGLRGVEELVFFDTLPLAQLLFDESAKLEDLAERLGISPGRAHHALDDASTLVGVIGRLGELRLCRTRKTALPNLLGYLGLALALELATDRTAEEQLLGKLALPSTVGQYSGCLEVYAEECGEHPEAPDLAELTERLGGDRLIERVRAKRSAAERYPAAVARLDSLVAASGAPNLSESIDLMLARVALSTSDGPDVDPHRVNLLTLHSTKSLEFSRVYLVGVEDNQLPGYWALEHHEEEELQEARRLLYVGMTRAKERLVITRTLRRDGRDTGGTLFLGEAALESTYVDS